MREILIIVFGKIEFINDLEKSNFNSIMGTKPDWSERKSEDKKWKVESGKQRAYVIFKKIFIVEESRETGQLLEGKAWGQGKDFNIYDDDYDNNYCHHNHNHRLLSAYHVPGTVPSVFHT